MYVDARNVINTKSVFVSFMLFYVVNIIFVNFEEK